MVIRRRSPFHLVHHIATGELRTIDRFLETAKQGEESSRKTLERRAAKWGDNAPDDDWLTDDFASLDDFAALSAEFSIIGTWRCVELFRKGVIRLAFGERAAAKPIGTKCFRNSYQDCALQKRGYAVLDP